jgi:AraC family transcriptional regulator
VVAAIVADPLADHRLEDLAALAHFSPFHFHRIYHGIAGETVAATVRRVRLALAGRMLTGDDTSVTEIALAVGYDSPQAFTRAFTQFTGQSPRQFRQHMNKAALHPKPTDAQGPTASGEHAESGFEVRIVQRPAQSVHALRHQGPFSTIPHTHRRLRAQLGAQTVSGWFGISYGNPEMRSDFRHYVAAALPDPRPAAEAVHGIEHIEIPGGLYAMHCLGGRYTRINAAVQALYRRWLPESGYEPDDRPTLEHYLNSPRQVPPDDLRTELLIPVRPAR